MCRRTLFWGENKRTISTAHGHDHITNSIIHAWQRMERRGKNGPFGVGRRNGFDMYFHLLKRNLRQVMTSTGIDIEMFSIKAILDRMPSCWHRESCFWGDRLLLFSSKVLMLTFKLLVPRKGRKEGRCWQSCYRARVCLCQSELKLIILNWRRWTCTGAELWHSNFAFIHFSSM